MTDFETYLIPNSINRTTLIEAIAERYITQSGRTERTSQTCCDTYDWFLFRNNLMLFRDARGFSLSCLQTNTTIGTIPWTSDQPPNFQREFKDVPVRGKVRKVLRLRALIPRARMDKEIQGLSVLDDLDKTVLRLSFETTHVGRTPINAVILKPVRGYREPAAEISRILSRYGDRHTSAEILVLVLNASGADPSRYPAEMDVALEPEMHARDAVIAILRQLLAVIRVNEDGIKSDIDTECLHDYRVAVRRTRAALAQIKRIFPEEAITPFRNYFRDLGRASNALRDHDVYLLGRERFEAMLPEEWRPRLAPLFDAIRTERDRHQGEFVARLNSQSYCSGLTDWACVLNAGHSETAAESKNACKPVIKVARKAIRKRYARVIAAGSAIDTSSPGKDLHNLRLHCKKLRYLLEFFSPLFPADTMAHLIGQLKNLQDNLGEFCDLAVQQPKLRAFIGRLGSEADPDLNTAAAIGGLVAALYQRQQDVRRDFGRTFAEFSARESADVFPELFGNDRP